LLSLHSFPTRRSSDLLNGSDTSLRGLGAHEHPHLRPDSFQEERPEFQRGSNEILRPLSTLLRADRLCNLTSFRRDRLYWVNSHCELSLDGGTRCSSIRGPRDRSVHRGIRGEDGSRSLSHVDTRCFRRSPRDDWGVLGSGREDGSIRGGFSSIHRGNPGFQRGFLLDLCDCSCNDNECRKRCSSDAKELHTTPRLLQHCPGWLHPNGAGHSIHDNQCSFGSGGWTLPRSELCNSEDSRVRRGGGRCY